MFKWMSRFVIGTEAKTLGVCTVFFCLPASLLPFVFFSSAFLLASFLVPWNKILLICPMRKYIQGRALEDHDSSTWRGRMRGRGGPSHTFRWVSGTQVRIRQALVQRRLFSFQTQFLLYSEMQQPSVHDISESMCPAQLVITECKQPELHLLKVRLQLRGSMNFHWEGNLQSNTEKEPQGVPMTVCLILNYSFVERSLDLKVGRFS